jgi:hypothetical protein
VAPGFPLVVHPPADPDSMIESCGPFDAGVASEPGHVANNALALSNKALTYPAAGLALILSDTAGQRPLADSLGGDAIVYRPGDVETLAEGLRRWAVDPSALARARAAAWEAAQHRWYWEHPSERDALLAAVAAVAG